MTIGSREVAAAAIRLALTPDRESEKTVRTTLGGEGFTTAAVDFGGDYITSIQKAIEHAVVAARREHVIGDNHNEEGAVAGAAREAISQLMTRALGLNVGGKIAVARYDGHVGVAMFFGVGLGHLNDVGIALGHRVI